MQLLKNKYYLMKYKAGALQFTIAFALLVMMVLLSFLLFNQVKGSEIVYLQINQGLARDIDSSVLIMEESPLLFENEPSEVCLNRDIFIDSVHVAVKNWGFYHCVSFIERHRQFAKEKSFLFTDDIRRNKLRPSLYLADQYKYLSIGGKTYLGTDTYLPAYGIRKAYLDGIGYYRDSLVQGVSHAALPNLPALDERLKNKYEKMMNGISKKDSIVLLESITSDTINNSFAKKRLVIRCPENSVLENMHFTGHIVLFGTSLKIKNTVTLENCVVLVQTLDIEKRFCGSGQFIAGNSLNIGDSCQFYSPTVLNADGNESSEGIHLGSGCFLSGDIIQPSRTSLNTEVLTLGEHTKMIGQVYCNGIVSFQGTLFGSMFCRGFMFRTPRGVFSNYLLNSCIDYSRLPKEFGGVSLTSEKNGKKCLLEVF